MITYNVDETEQAVNFVENNLNFLGKIKSIEHKRLNLAPHYRTIIIGSEESLTINGGLSSGYTGEGPRGLMRILEKLDIENDAAEHYSRDTKIYKKGFLHKF